MANSPDAENAKKLLMYPLGITICGGIASIFQFRALWQQQGELMKASAWQVRQAWRTAECKVLTAGVSCVEEDTGSTCYGFGANGSTHHVVDGTSVYKYTDIAVCPGTYWCAKEEEDCICEGEVSYAPELFNGYQYTEVDPEFRWNASGTLKCGTDKNGKPFEKDPAPYHTKHCWCTPQHIIAKLHDLGGIAAVRKRRDDCAKESNSAYLEGAAGDAPSDATGDPGVRQESAETTRRLQPDSSGSLEVQDDGDGGAGTGEADVPQRQLTTSSPRRRRTFAYTPWALVEVPLEEGDDGFGSDRLSGQEKKKHSAFTCAYDFGVPTASYKDFESDGGEHWLGDPGASGTAQAQTERWAEGATRTCYARSQGLADADTCAVALEPLEELGQRREAQIWWTRFWAWFAFGVAICPPTCIVTCCCCMHLRETQYERFPE